MRSDCRVLPSNWPAGVSTRSEYQVSEGVKKRLAEMNRAEASRVVNAMCAESWMRFPEFKELLDRNPDWAAKVRNLAERVHTAVKPEEDDQTFLLVRI